MSNGLTKQHTAKSLLVFALPTIVMMVFMSMYIMIDGIFVANFVSPDALAGLNIREGNHQIQTCQCVR